MYRLEKRFVAFIIDRTRQEERVGDVVVLWRVFRANWLMGVWSFISCGSFPTSAHVGIMHWAPVNR